MKHQSWELVSFCIEQWLKVVGWGSHFFFQRLSALLPAPIRSVIKMFYLTWLIGSKMEGTKVIVSVCIISLKNWFLEAMRSNVSNRIMMNSISESESGYFINPYGNYVGYSWSSTVALTKNKLDYLSIQYVKIWGKAQFIQVTKWNIQGWQIINKYQETDSNIRVRRCAGCGSGVFFKTSSCYKYLDQFRHKLSEPLFF